MMEPEKQCFHRMSPPVSAPRVGGKKESQEPHPTGLGGEAAEGEQGAGVQTPAHHAELAQAGFPEAWGGVHHCS